ncbi:MULTISPECIES: TrmH family RNA methyltransferase [unclassified Brevundimonas]|jgi:tRNA G18 (ribose-2'-O)-methylase SpoU|uniref:TrmH family RNA methyltransferase n=1 Tax=unclassified Brevundimonas TaxID=2622653 RepID=UPI000C66F58B|nr:MULTISPECIES: RNA methyltransferase [unclassified Brevundimonas]MAL87774.1 RNA methyltransferase [Brevundimonas sp.]HAV48899.1 RNA methyltransferase [Brevundimonas sp.]|tara:strand:+ start:639 stop:1439 length:801 start_codon:yes stop_codon:yes gene_type:complete
MTPISLTSADDPRIAAFRDVRERDLTGREGLFIAEGEVVLNVLTSAWSRCRARAVLLADKRLAKLEPVLSRLEADVPVYTAPQEVLDGIAGFHLHRGILALGEKPAPLDADAFLATRPERSVLVGAVGIGNADNMGGIFRNAAALGACGVMIDPGCCDPFYRKAIRVSVGAVLRTPLMADLSALAMVEQAEAYGYVPLALTPWDGPDLLELEPPARSLVLLGAEGPGLSPEVLARARPVRIPMASGFDSLNVAATSAIVLHHLTRR